MQHNLLTAHELAAILLKCEDIPVVIPSLKKDEDAEHILNIYKMQHDLSPFEHVIFLEGSKNIIDSKLIEIPDKT